MQAALEQLKAHVQDSAQEREASDADWEQRLKQAIDSAEKWQAFAGSLGSDKAALQAQATTLADQAQVERLLGACTYHTCTPHRGSILAAKPSDVGQRPGSRMSVVYHELHPPLNDGIQLLEAGTLSYDAQQAL